MKKNIFSREPIYIAVDTETTGLDASVHGICQIGAFTQVEGATYEFSVDVNCLPCEISDQALAVNGFTRERIAAGQPLGLAFIRFANWLASFDNVVLVMQNAAFDKSFITAGLKRVAPGTLFEMLNVFSCRPSYEEGDTLEQHLGLRRVLDTMPLGFSLLPQLKELPALARLADMVLGESYATSWNKHDALGDARTTFHIAMVLLQRRARLLMASAFLLDSLHELDNDRIEQGADYNPKGYLAGYTAAIENVKNVLEHGALA